MNNHEKLINKIALGSVQFGLDYGISNENGKTPTKEITEILNYCTSIGISTLDTAYSYGQSELELGKNKLNNFKIVSKFLPQSECNYSIEQQLEISLERLKVNHLYGYISHRPLQLTKKDWDKLLKLKMDGIIQKIGFSFNDPIEIEKILNNNFCPDLIQVPFNYFDNRFENKLIFLKEYFQTEVHTRSAFLQGLFFMNPDNLSDFFNPVKKDLIKIQQNQYLAGFLLNYALKHPFVDKVVVGVNNIQQLTQNIEEVRKNEYKVVKSDFHFPDEILNPSKWPQLTKN